MPTFRYQNDGMPNYLRDTARRNLATADTQISAFNNRMKYFPMTSQPATNGATNGQPQEQQGSSFKFSGIGGPVDTSIGAPVSSFKEPTIANTTNTQNNGGDWRFRGFSPSQLNGNGGGTALDKGAYGQQVSPVVTPVNPTGAGTPSPVIPADYQPKDVTDLQKKYGWGSGS